MPSSKCVLYIAWENILNNFLDLDFDSCTFLLHFLSGQITEVRIFSPTESFREIPGPNALVYNLLESANYV